MRFEREGDYLVSTPACVGSMDEVRKMAVCDHVYTTVTTLGEKGQAFDIQVCLCGARRFRAPMPVTSSNKEEEEDKGDEAV